MKDKEIKVEDVEAPHTLGGAWSWSCKPDILVEGLQFQGLNQFIQSLLDLLVYRSISHAYLLNCLSLKS